MSELFSETFDTCRNTLDTLSLSKSWQMTFLEVVLSGISAVHRIGFPQRSVSLDIAEIIVYHPRVIDLLVQN